MLKRSLGDFVEDPSKFVFLFVWLCFWKKQDNNVARGVQRPPEHWENKLETTLTDPSSLPLLYAHLLSDTWPKLHLPRAGDVVYSGSSGSWVRGPRGTPDRCQGREVSPVAGHWDLHCAYSEMHRFQWSTLSQRISEAVTTKFARAAAVLACWLVESSFRDALCFF